MSLTKHLEAIRDLDRADDRRIMSLEQPLTPQELTQDQRETLHESYALKIAIAVDQLANVVTGGNPDETISSRAARAAKEGKQWGILLTAALDKLQGNHGVLAEGGDLQRAESVVMLENSQSGDLPK